MKESLSSIFQKIRGAPTEVDGRFVYPIFKEHVEKGERNLRIRRLASKQSPVQGIRIKMVKGLIEIYGRKYSEIVLWADTSPTVVDLKISSRSGGELRAWNVWKIDDITQAWIGNAGIRIAKEGGVVTLECSDGVGDIDFSNLVVEVDARA
ncbi:MAG TPA: hypothetical protein VGN52_08800 [Burkholderiales bacterium]|jgi:hypothetical protein